MHVQGTHICTGYAQVMYIRTGTHTHSRCSRQNAAMLNGDAGCVKPTFKSMSSSAALVICMSPNVLGASSRVPISKLSSLLSVAPCCTNMMRAFTFLPASSGMKGGPGVCSKDKTHTRNQFQK